MRDYGEALNTHLATLGPRHAEILLWVQCRHRITGTAQPVGLWTGAQTMDFVIGGEVRTYYGAGAILSDPQITRAIGLDVRLTSLTLSRRHPAVRQMIDVNDPRNVPAEIRRASYDPATGVLIDEPALEFDGEVDAPDARNGGIGGTGELTLKLVPITNDLTRDLPDNWSDETARQNNDDRILRYASISGKSTVWWGTKRISE